MNSLQALWIATFNVGEFFDETYNLFDRWKNFKLVSWGYALGKAAKPIMVELIIDQPNRTSIAPSLHDFDVKTRVVLDALQLQVIVHNEKHLAALTWAANQVAIFSGFMAVPLKDDEAEVVDRYTEPA